MPRILPVEKRAPLLLALMVTTLLSINSMAQVPFQRRIIPSISDGSFKSVIFGSASDTTALLVANTGLLELNLNTGTAGGQKITVNGKPANFSAGYRAGKSVFLTGTPGSTGSEYDTTWLFKYDLQTGSFQWAKAFTFQASPARFTSITGVGDGALYISGKSWDTTNLSNVVLLKVDTSGSVSWSKTFGSNSEFVSTPIISYVNDRSIYVSYIDWHSSINGNANTIRIDSAGNILATGSIVNPTTSPRFGDCFATVVDGSLCTFYTTYMGPSDGGPVLARITDTSCTTVSSKTISGLQGQSVAAGSGSIVLSGQGYVSNGITGFRTARFDGALNLIATNHYDKIPTFSFASAVYSMMLPGGYALHCFRHGSDSLHIMLADNTEKTHCREKDFTPGTTPEVAFSETPFVYTSGPAVYSVTAMTPLAISLNELSVYADDECALPNMISETGPVGTIVSVYPNPATDVLTLPAGTEWAVIFSTDGKLVKLHSAGEGVDVSTLSTGLYFIKLHFATGETTLRFSKL